MSKIIGVFLVICLFITGCGKKDIDNNRFQSSNTQEETNITQSREESLQVQKFTFGPKVKEEEVTNETKEELQKYINKLGNPEKDNISFNGFSAKFREDGALILSTFIRNGYDYTIYNIEAKVDVKKSGQVVATAVFKLTEKEFGELNSKESRVWNLVYEPEHILVKNVDLKEYILEYTTQYSRK